MDKGTAETVAATMGRVGIQTTITQDLYDRVSHRIEAYDPRFKNSFSIGSVTEWEAYVLAVAQIGILDKVSAFTYMLDELNLAYTLVDLVLIANSPKLDEPPTGRRIMDWRTYCHMFQDGFMRLPLERRIAIVAMGLYKANQEEWD